MRDFLVLLWICWLTFTATIKAEDCDLVIRRRKTASIARRYQPRTICEECNPIHQNMLILGMNPLERLKKCSKFTKIEGVASLKTTLTGYVPESLVFIFANYHPPPDAKILDVIMEKQGNVSVLISPGVSVTRAFHKHCNHPNTKCFPLDNLMPVISHVELQNAHEASFFSKEEEEQKAMLEVYNARSEVPANLTNVPLRHKAPSAQNQMEKLVTELCRRNHTRNHVVLLTQSAHEIARAKLLLEDEQPYPAETSLAINDILPINPKAYDKNRPPKRPGDPTKVYFHVTVLSLDSINEESMTYVADIFLAQSWRDSRLRLPENMSEEYRILDVEWLKNIWRPDCFFKNAKKVTFHEMSIPNHYLWLYHDKTLLYMAKLTLVLSCAMKFESYPHDTQVCSMMIESLSHTTHDLVFLWNITDPLVVNPEIELPQLDISNNYTTDCTLTYSTGNFTCLAVVFTLRRRLGYHLFHTYIPSALIVVMSWISFWIKPEAIPARVTLGVTSLLTLATQNTQSQQSLPPVSYVKAIDVWMSSCSVFVFLSLFEFAVVNNYMGPVATKAMKGFSDDDLRSGIDDCRDTSVRCRTRTSVATVPQYDTCYGRSTALMIDKFSRFFFPFSFFILNVVYWSTFL